MAFLTKAANRGSIATGYDIENSLKLESDNLETLYAVPWSSAGTRTTHTWSIWVKRTELGTRQVLFEGGTLTTVTTQLSLSFQTNDALEVRAGEFVPGSVAGTVYRLTNRVFRDTSAWYHIVAAFDTTQATANNRIKIWINGVQETSFATIANPAQNTDLGLFAANAQQTVGKSSNNGFSYNGYVTHAALVYNQQLDADSFGEFDEDTVIWKPIDLEDLTFGAFGFWLKFENSSSLGTDSSGNNHGFTTPNISSADQATDTPTNNFCTLFPPPTALGYGQEPSIKEGGTTMFNGAYATQNAFGTIGVRSGKWYFESTITNSGGISTINHGFGVIDPEEITYVTVAGGVDIGYFPAGWACSSNSVPRNNNAAASGANATGALNENEIMGVAIDMDNGKIWWHRQGTWTSLNNTVGNPVNGTEPAFSNLLTATDNFVVPGGGCYFNSGSEIRVMNFGGYAQAVFTAVGTYTDANGYGSFAYQPPSGYYALCSKNLAEYG